VPDSSPDRSRDPTGDTAPEPAAGGLPRQVTLGDDSSANGLAQLVLTLVKLLHDVLEKQAIRRMESGRLTAEQVEQVGQTLKRQAEEIERLCEVFDLDPSDLDLSVGTVQGIDATDLE
jgi:hypothetical protein